MRQEAYTQEPEVTWVLAILRGGGDHTEASGRTQAPKRGLAPSGVFGSFMNYKRLRETGQGAGLPSARLGGEDKRF